MQRFKKLFKNNFKTLLKSLKLNHVLEMQNSFKSKCNCYCYSMKKSLFVIQRHLLLKVVSAQEERKDVLLVVHIIVIPIVISMKKTFV